MQLFAEMQMYSPEHNLDQFNGPLLIVHGTNDSKVEYKATLEVFKRLTNSNKTFDSIEGSEHGFHEEPFETLVTNKIVDFFSANLE